MRNKLVQKLVEHQGTFISGESLSQSLGVSRTAVWKQMDALKKSGYQIDSVPKKGYQLIARPNGIQEHDIHLYVQTKRLGHTVTYYDSVPTTQTLAHEWAEGGAKEGHLIVADEQTGGRGRLGRNWHSTFGTSISMSLILRPKLSPQQTPQLTLVAAVAVTRAIEKVTQLKADIKWPNDILIKGKKLVGILTEMQSEPGLAKVVILGIGINANQSEDELSHDERNQATSLKVESGLETNRAQLIATVLEEFEWLYDTYLEKGFSEIKLLWEARSISIGKKLKAQTINGTVTGMSTGITAEGALLLEDDEGIVHTIYSADIDQA
ncbi:biotin--[acetyl-CoA-carboxylase] ligase [Alkalicoccobacillus murimartini]|uniref:Bifunctional ligase/repressor BirA n=1 Tax=Alkalicoccobacillus murimartini TaxID=171685 RepID=A0ABT9YE94_9BACI|nr:biotin--[acetyl-CoA-carboxylase] ligase [Alkalicoccobacillus murimartini]MDQ0205948.1 BirA family biotin operon repressor/biotin-[acetyl-CoA-carboxylase] ligase [Alkalicoccobacillus murimartini]